MTNLLDLPPEMLQEIIHAYVRDGWLAEVLRSRRVCKTFTSYIDFQLLAKMPPEDLVRNATMVDGLTRCETSILTPRYPALTVFGGTRAVFRRRFLESYLLHRVICLNGVDPFLPDLLRQAADNLLQITPHSSDRGQPANRYLQDLVRVVCKSNRHDIRRFLVRTFSPESNIRQPHHAALFLTTAPCLLSAAATVGDLRAVKYYSDAKHMEDSIWLGEMLPYPFTAAAMNGHITVLKFFGDLIIRERDNQDSYELLIKILGTPPQIPRYPFLGTKLRYALRTAISACSYTAAEYLINLIRKIDGNLDNDVSPNESLIALCEAIRTGCLNTYKTVSRAILREADASILQCNFSHSLAYTIRNGQLDMVEHLIENNVIALDEKTCNRDLAIALKAGRPRMARFFIDRMSTIIGVRAFTAALNAPRGRKLEMTKILLRCIGVSLATARAVDTFAGEVIHLSNWNERHLTRDEVGTLVVLGLEMKRNFVSEGNSRIWDSRSRQECIVAHNLRKLLFRLHCPIPTRLELEPEFYTVGRSLWTWLAFGRYDEEATQGIVL